MVSQRQTSEKASLDKTSQGFPGQVFKRLLCRGKEKRKEEKMWEGSSGQSGRVVLFAASGMGEL